MRGLVIGFCGSLLACQAGLPEIEHEGERVRVATFFPEQICAGDIQEMDDFVGRTQDTLGLGDGERVNVYLFKELSKPEVMRGCPDDSGGCYNRAGNFIVSSWNSLEHELAHSVVERLGHSAEDLFYEGAAAALANERFAFGGSDPQANLGTDEDLDLGTARAFMRWLLLEHGDARFAELLGKKGRDPEEDFEEVYGFSFGQATDDYFETAPWMFSRLDPCAHPPLQATSANSWAETLPVDCAQTDTIAYGEEMVATRRTITITTPGAYNVYSEAGNAVELWGCQMEAFAEAPAEAVDLFDASAHAVRHELWGMVAGTRAEGGQIAQMTVVLPGTYRVTAISSAEGPKDVAVAIWPALQSRP